MAKFTRESSSRKAATRPDKPYEKFPLYPHPSGAWAKRILGHLHYFGRWGRIRGGVMERLPGDGWKEALDLYNAQAEALHAGRTPRLVKEGDVTLGDLRDKFLTAKSRAWDAGEITERTYAEYKANVQLLLGQFGERRLIDDINAEDFEKLRVHMADKWGPVRLGNQIQKIRTFFKYGYEIGVIKQPVRFGPGFKKPSARILRTNRNDAGEKFLESEQCRAILDTAPVPVKAMILLGLNCGFGNHDCATLPLSALDLERGWVNYPRPKTGIKRRCPLWPETVTALRDALAERPEPKNEEGEGLVFITAQRRPWLSGGIANPVSGATRKVMKAAGIHHKDYGHYVFRHIFRTVADGAKDQIAANAIMGHADGSMAATYRERIDDSRLLAVTNYVRAWLYPEGFVVYNGSAK